VKFISEIDNNIHRITTSLLDSKQTDILQHIHSNNYNIIHEVDDQFKGAINN